MADQKTATTGAAAVAASKPAAATTTADAKTAPAAATGTATAAGSATGVASGPSAVLLAATAAQADEKARQFAEWKKNPARAFEIGVRIGFDRWDALTLAVTRGWTESAKAKREALIEEVLGLYDDENTVERTELEDLLEERLFEEFNVDAQDNSTNQLARLITVLDNDCAVKKDFEGLWRMTRAHPHIVQAQSAARDNADDDDGEGEGDDGEGDDDDGEGDDGDDDGDSKSDSKSSGGSGSSSGSRSKSAASSAAEAAAAAAAAPKLNFLVKKSNAPVGKHVWGAASAGLGSKLLANQQQKETADAKHAVARKAAFDQKNAASAAPAKPTAAATPTPATATTAAAATTTIASATTATAANTAVVTAPANAAVAQPTPSSSATAASAPTTAAAPANDTKAAPATAPASAAASAPAPTNAADAAGGSDAAVADDGWSTVPQGGRKNKKKGK